MTRRSKGQGSLYQAGDKTWVYQYYDEDNKRRTRRFSRKTEARAFADALLAAAQSPLSGGKVTPMTVTEWMDQWLETYARPVIKLSTYTSYETYIRGHVKPEIGSLYINRLTTLDLQKFFNERAAEGNLKGDGGLSPKTLRNLRNMLHLALEQAVRERILPYNPIDGVRLPRDHKKEMRVLSLSEQNRLIWAAKAMPEPAAFGIIFTLFTGVRIGELCGLRWENVSMEHKVFRICETRNRLPNHDARIASATSVITARTAKTDSSLRTVYIMDELYQDLARYRMAQEEIRKPRTYQDLFKRCVRRAGIQDANFHALRHTFATRALEHSMDVVTLSRILGHANPSITLDKYGHTLEEHKKRSVNQMGDIYQHTAQQRMAVLEEAQSSVPELTWGW